MNSSRLLTPLFLALWCPVLIGCPLLEDDAGEPDPNAENQVETDEECVELTPLWASAIEPGAVSLHMQARDCDGGERLGDLEAHRFDFTENDLPLSADAELQPISGGVVRPYISLFVDATGEEATWDELRDAASAFIDHVLDENPISGAHVGVELYDGSTATDERWQPPVDDPGVLHAFLDGFEPTDAESPEPAQAVADGVDRLRDHQQRVYERNHGGVIPAGHHVLLTTGEHFDGDSPAAADHIAAARSGGTDATAAVATRAVVITDLSTETVSGVRALVGGEQWVRTRAPIERHDAARFAAGDVAADLDATYLFAYCSEARGGTVEIDATVSDADSDAARFAVLADGFTDGCAAQFLQRDCQDLECGGFHCGGCADTTEICDGADTGQCIYYCLDQVVCTDRDIVTDLGHEKNCYMGPTVTECADQCVDLSIDDEHCGDCDIACTAATSECVDGECLCDDGSRDCGGECVDLSTSTEHCGECGNGCPEGVDCEDGECDCGEGLTFCGGECVDTTSDLDHCGNCGFGCGGFHNCEDGECTCDEGYGYCGDQCVDIFSDDDYCGGCDNTCEDGQTCENASCVCEAENEAICGETCVDTTTSDAHCGQCDHACPEGVDCVDGVCDCGGGEIGCNGECLDPQSDPDHCGECGNACEADEFCDGGTCAVAPVLDEKKISAGQDHSCAVHTDGTVECWGSDSDKQSDPPADPFTHVSAGQRYTCGVRADTLAHCWGRNLSGESAPPPASTFVQLDAATTHSCGVNSDSELECWGSDQDGKTDPPAGTFTQVSVAQDHSCAVRDDNAVVCWGEDDDVAGSKANPPSGSFTHVSAGLRHSCGLRTDGAVECWGDNDQDQADPPDEDFVAVSAGGAHSCGIDTDDQIHCWGSDNADQTDAPEGSFYAVSAGFLHTCAIDTDDVFHCWGHDDDGQADP